MTYEVLSFGLYLAMTLMTSLETYLLVQDLYKIGPFRSPSCRGKGLSQNLTVSNRPFIKERTLGTLSASSHVWAQCRGPEMEDCVYGA